MIIEKEDLDKLNLNRLDELLSAIDCYGCPLRKDCRKQNSYNVCELFMKNYLKGGEQG